MPLEDDLEGFSDLLSELVTADKSTINAMTIYASEVSERSGRERLAELVKARVISAQPQWKLPALYLMDSIVKNTEPKLGYRSIFTPHLHAMMEATFRACPELVDKLHKLRSTWVSHFPENILYRLDVTLNKSAPRGVKWEILDTPPPFAAPVAVGSTTSATAAVAGRQAVIPTSNDNAALKDGRTAPPPAAVKKAVHGNNITVAGKGSNADVPVRSGKHATVIVNNNTNSNTDTKTAMPNVNKRKHTIAADAVYNNNNQSSASAAAPLRTPAVGGDKKKAAVSPSSAAAAPVATFVDRNAQTKRTKVGGQYTAVPAADGSALHAARQQQQRTATTEPSRGPPRFPPTKPSSAVAAPPSIENKDPLSAEELELFFQSATRLKQQRHQRHQRQPNNTAGGRARNAGGAVSSPAAHGPRASSRQVENAPTLGSNIPRMAHHQPPSWRPPPPVMAAVPPRNRPPLVDVARANPAQLGQHQQQPFGPPISHSPYHNEQQQPPNTMMKPAAASFADYAQPQQRFVPPPQQQHNNNSGLLPTPPLPPLVLGAYGAEPSYPPPPTYHHHLHQPPQHIMPPVSFGPPRFGPPIFDQQHHNMPVSSSAFTPPPPQQQQQQQQQLNTDDDDPLLKFGDADIQRLIDAMTANKTDSSNSGLSPAAAASSPTMMDPETRRDWQWDASTMLNNDMPPKWSSLRDCLNDAALCVSYLTELNRTDSENSDASASVQQQWQTLSARLKPNRFADEPFLVRHDDFIDTDYGLHVKPAAETAAAGTMAETEAIARDEAVKSVVSSPNNSAKRVLPKRRMATDVDDSAHKQLVVDITYDEDE